MELEVAQKLVVEIESAELFLYRAMVICSRITASTTTTKKPRAYSSSTSSRSWSASNSGPFPEWYRVLAELAVPPMVQLPC